MLKCITFDGDTSTLNTLMGYFEKLDKIGRASCRERV